MKHRPILCLLIVLLGAAAAHAQTDLDALQRLGDPSYAVRQAATMQLLQDHDLTPQGCIELYRRATSPEQRHRLIMIAQHHLLRTLRQEQFPARSNGVIGISLEGHTAESNPHLQQPAVRVVLTLAGFPGHEHLQVGDMIVGVDGQSLGGGSTPQDVRDRFMEQIGGRVADEVVQLRVWRHGQFLDVRLTLAGRDALNGLYGERTRMELPNSVSQQCLDLRRRMQALEPPTTPLRPAEPTR